MICGSTVAGASGLTCASMLEIPEIFHAQFDQYVGTQFMPPLNLVGFSENQLDGVVLNISAPWAHPKVFSDVSIEMTGSFTNTRRTKFRVEKIDIHPSLPQEIAWRIVCPHLLARRQRITTIYWDSLEVADEAILREALTEGLAAAAALRRTSFYKSLLAFGFELGEVKASLVEVKRTLTTGEASASGWMKRTPPR